MRKIARLLALLCLISGPSFADGLLTQPGWFYSGFGNTLVLNNCTLGTDSFCVNGTTSVGNVNVTSTTIPTIGIYEVGSTSLAFATGGANRWNISAGGTLSAANASGPQFVGGAAASCTAPSVIPSRGASTTGFSGNGTLLCLAFAGVDTYDFATSGITAKGTIPTVTGTGTPTIATGSTDTAGEVTGGTAATSIVITFSATKTNAPFCTVSSQTQLVSFAYTISTSAITITETATTGDKIDYTCMQH